MDKNKEIKFGNLFFRIEKFKPLKAEPYSKIHMPSAEKLQSPLLILGVDPFSFSLAKPKISKQLISQFANFSPRIKHALLDLKRIYILTVIIASTFIVQSIMVLSLCFSRTFY